MRRSFQNVKKIALAHPARTVRPRRGDDLVSIDPLPELAGIKRVGTEASSAARSHV
jgi:hypothetical protein